MYAIGIGALIIAFALVIGAGVSEHLNPPAPFEVGTHYAHDGYRDIQVLDEDFTSPLLGWTEVVRAYNFCTDIPLDELHPESLKTLDNWSRMLMYDDGFKVIFSLPNSSYLGIPECILWVTRGQTT